MKSSVSKNYFTARDRQNFLKLLNVLDELPAFCDDFFIALESRTTTLTRLAYAYDLRVFFNYLVNESQAKDYQGRDIREITITELQNLPSIEIERFLSYLTYYTDKQGGVSKNSEKAKARKLSALRALFKYFIKKEIISRDPTAAVDAPKLRQKNIIRLEGNEIPKMLHVAETGEGLTKHQKAYHKNTALRDTAMVALFLGTGIRVSELVGLDINDVNFDNFSFVVTRKGGNREQLFFSDEVADILYEYYQERIKDEKVPPKENALFLSLRKSRITTRAVENIIKKYGTLAAVNKKITPHKLRSTFGTQLYRKTGDIYMVADVLGHKDINTTKKHYAAITEDIRKKASVEVSLKEITDED